MEMVVCWQIIKQIFDSECFYLVELGRCSIRCNFLVVVEIAPSGVPIDSLGMVFSFCIALL